MLTEDLQFRPRMSGYTKLFSSILASTIWRTDHATRIVWITMLAMTDKFGRVEASVPGLADFARVTVAECRTALTALESPDPDSRSKEEDGRRITPIEGGWQLINHAKYRAKLSADDRRDYLAQKQREWRAKHKGVTRVSTTVTNVNDTSRLSTHTDPDPDPDPKADPKADTDQKQKKKDQDLSRKKRREREMAYSPEFLTFWKRHHKGSKPEAFEAWTALAPSAALMAEIHAALDWQTQQPKWREQGGKFIKDSCRWLKDRRWEDEPFHADVNDALSANDAAWAEAERLQERKPR